MLKTDVLHIITFIGIIWCNVVSTQQLKGKLIFSQILFRHGDRTPISSYPNDPWNDLKYWPTGWGQLTNTGKLQHYELGQWFRDRYGHLIKETYSRDDIYIESTDVDRTLMSALSNLAGLYRPKNEDANWNPNLSDWQPIPIHTAPEEQDFILAAKKSCAAYEIAKAELKQTDEFQQLYKKYAPVFAHLTVKSGKTVNTINDVLFLYNILFIENLYNKTLPDWAHIVFNDPDIKYLSDFAFLLETYTRKMARLKIGPLLKEIFHRFTLKVNDELSPNRSLWIYSGHDLTVANLLNGLKIFDVHSPPYTASVLMELRMYQNKPLISILYKNTTDNLHLFKIPNCGIQCPLNKMIKLYKEILPENWFDECKVSTFNYSYVEAPNSQYAMGILLISASAILAMILIIYMILLVMRQGCYSDYRSF